MKPKQEALRELFSYVEHAIVHLRSRDQSSYRCWNDALVYISLL